MELLDQRISANVRADVGTVGKQDFLQSVI